MRKALGLLVVLLMTIPRVIAAQRAGASDDAQAIRELIAAVEAANNAGDVEKWVGLFASDFVYMAPNTPAVTARDSLVEVAKAGFRHQASVTIEPVEIRVQGDWGYARNAVSGTVKLHGSGQEVTVDVKQLVVYTRERDGQWRIARLMSNPNR